MGRARDISKVFSTSTSLSTDSEVSGSYLTLASASTTYQTKASNGLTKVVPSSVTVGSGTGSVDATGTITFNAASSVSFNGCFTTTYKNYKIIFRATQNTSSGTLSSRLRAAGTDISGAVYTNGGIESGITENNVRIGAYSLTSWGFFTTTTNNISVVVLDLLGPQVANQTLGFYNAFSTNKGDNRVIAIQVGTNDSYDSLSFITSAGSLTGTAEIYGYTN